KLLAKYGNVEDFLVDDPFARTAAAAAAGQGRGGAYVSSRPPIPGRLSDPPLDFKRALADLHVAALNKAKTDGNVTIDLLARLAILKFLRAELGIQFAQLTEKGRARLKGYSIGGKSVELRERVSKFQVSKRTVLRRAGQDIFSTIREIEKETLAKLRRSLFG